ncbi:hypothetical protein DFH09DRAFT_1362550 [Mycena vulgaris]|nr:hypothetical protein DFH09DRAFT_1362550 [Mycena vulgaris]
MGADARAHTFVHSQRHDSSLLRVAQLGQIESAANRDYYLEAKHVCPSRERECCCHVDLLKSVLYARPPRITGPTSGSTVLEGTMQTSGHTWSIWAPSAGDRMRRELPTARARDFPASPHAVSSPSCVARRALPSSACISPAYQPVPRDDDRGCQLQDLPTRSMAWSVQACSDARARLAPEMNERLARYPFAPPPLLPQQLRLRAHENGALCSLPPPLPASPPASSDYKRTRATRAPPSSRLSSLILLPPFSTIHRSQLRAHDNGGLCSLLLPPPSFRLSSLVLLPPFSTIHRSQLRAHENGGLSSLLLSRISFSVPLPLVSMIHRRSTVLPPLLPRSPHQHAQTYLQPQLRAHENGGLSAILLLPSRILPALLPPDPSPVYRYAQQHRLRAHENGGMSSLLLAASPPAFSFLRYQ